MKGGGRERRPGSLPVAAGVWLWAGREGETVIKLDVKLIHESGLDCFGYESD